MKTLKIHNSSSVERIAKILMCLKTSEFLDLNIQIILL